MWWASVGLELWNQGAPHNEWAVYGVVRWYTSHKGGAKPVTYLFFARISPLLSNSLSDRPCLCSPASMACLRQAKTRTSSRLYERMGLLRLYWFGSSWYGRVSNSPSLTEKEFIAKVACQFNSIKILWRGSPFLQYIVCVPRGCLKFLSLRHRWQTTQAYHSASHSFSCSRLAASSSSRDGIAGTLLGVLTFFTGDPLTGLLSPSEPRSCRRRLLGVRSIGCSVMGWGDSALIRDMAQ